MVSLPDILLPKQKYFGLSIERTVLRAVEVDKKGNPIRLSEIQIPADTFVNGTVSDQKVFSKSISDLVKTGKITTPYVAVCFPEAFAYTRGHTLPVMSLDELDEAVRWQARDLFPFPSEELYFDWKIMEKDNIQAKVTVVAVQKVVLDQFVLGLQSAGLKPLRFEPDASALARLLTLKPQEHALLVDVHPKGAYITLVEADKSIFTTVVQYEKGSAPEEFLKVIDKTLHEINDFYIDKGILKPGSTGIIVTGDLASETWVKHLEELLKYKSQLLRSKVQKPSFSKAYAAAISGIAPPLDENSINLMPTALQKQYDTQRSSQFIDAFFMRVVLVMFFLCLISGSVLAYIAWQNQILSGRLRDSESEISSQPANVEKVLQLNSQADLIASLGVLRKTPKENMKALIEMLPFEIYVTQIVYDDRRLQYKISGTAATREGLIAFKNTLEKSDIFENVDLPLGTLEIPVQVPFIMTFIAK